MKWSDPATIARISFLNMVCNMGRIGHIAIYLMISIWHGGFAGVLSRHSHGRPGVSARPTRSHVASRIRRTLHRIACKERVSWPSLASLRPQAWRSLWRWT